MKPQPLKTVLWIALATLLLGHAMVFGANTSWKAWEGFKTHYLSEDGRIVDHSTDDKRTVSEGQAYALFFALIANDRSAFEKLLTWTVDNLSQGDLGQNLPSWLWGKKSDQWQVIDPNSASDADLWIIYSLLEASRYWCEPGYTTLASQLAQTVLDLEVLEVAGVGLSLLPGKNGFVQEDGTVKLNPSYAPPFLMNRLANAFPSEKKWAELYLASQRLLLKSEHNGLFPNWVQFRNGEPLSGSQQGSYDAIRVYLWIAMSDQDPLYRTLLERLTPFISRIGLLNRVPDRWMGPLNQISRNTGPSGFQHALNPVLHAAGKKEVAAPALPHSEDAQAWLEYGYYNSALTLFASGWSDKRYAFDRKGTLLLKGRSGGGCE